jgi:hypothetical protein
VGQSVLKVDLGDRILLIYVLGWGRDALHHPAINIESNGSALIEGR